MSQRRAAVALATFTALFFLNLWIAWRLLWIDYTIYMGSVEGAFVSLARHIRDHWPPSSWWPLWFCGMPHTHTYQPVVPYLTAAVSGIGGVSAARAYHAVLGCFYALGPATLAGLILRLTGRLDIAALGGLAYSLFSPCVLLLPLVRQDLGGWFLARRLQAAVIYADTPHVAALTLLPVALVLLSRAADRPTFLRALLAGVAVAAIALTNIPGAIAFGMAVAPWAVVYAGPRRRIAAAAGALAAASALTFLVVPPSTFAAILDNTAWMDPARGPAVQRAAALAGSAALFAGAALITARLRWPAHLRFAVLFTLTTGSVVLLNDWWRIVLIRQAGRFHLVFEMALILLAASAATLFRPRNRRTAAAAYAVVGALLALQVAHYRAYARDLLRPGDVTARSEYKVARWLHQNAGGARVLVPGSMAYWLNAFTDTPQLTGCCDQGVLMRSVKMAYYVIGSDDGAGDRAPEITIAWLRALGVRYVAVAGPGSTEVFKDFAHPGKLEGRLPAVWRDGGDVIYEVPSAAAGLAHLLRPGEVVREAPENGVRIEPLTAYLDALGDTARPPVDFRWQSPSEIHLATRARRGDVIGVQIAWDAGWQAAVNGHPRPVASDALGFMVIDAGCDGECRVVLRHRSRWLSARW